MIKRIFPKNRTRTSAHKLLPVVFLGLAIIFAFGACESESNNDTEQSQANNVGQTVPLESLTESEATDARATVLSYLSEQSWGFFGATCDKWVDLDYEFSVENSGTALDDVILVVFNLRPDRDLGSPTLKFELKPDGTVQGDNLLERSGIAEGCDQW